MKWHNVESSAIKAVAYNWNKKQLHVRFTNDREYTYAGIGAIRFRSLLKAESVGQYYNNAIRPKIIQPIRKSDHERIKKGLQTNSART